jgi:hypothetical protein
MLRTPPRTRPRGLASLRHAWRVRRLLAASVLSLAAVTACGTTVRRTLECIIVRIGSFRRSRSILAAPRAATTRACSWSSAPAGSFVVRGGTQAAHAVPRHSREGVLGGGERGLLSMAFAPDYASSGRFYSVTRTTAAT